MTSGCLGPWWNGQVSLSGADGSLYEGWYQDSLHIEQPGRGFIRSYTVRTRFPGVLEPGQSRFRNQLHTHTAAAPYPLMTSALAAINTSNYWVFLIDPCRPTVGHTDGRTGR